MKSLGRFVAAVRSVITETIAERIASQLTAVVVLVVLVVVGWSVVALFVALRRVLLPALALLICAGCALAVEGLESGPCATGAGQEVIRAKVGVVAMCAAMSACMPDYQALRGHPGVDGGVVDVGVGADRARVLDVAPDVVPDLAPDSAPDFPPDVPRVAVDVAPGLAPDVLAVRDLHGDVVTCRQAARDLQSGESCVVPGSVGLLWIDGGGRGYNCVASTLAARSCWTWELFGGQYLTYIVQDCTQCQVRALP